MTGTQEGRQREGTGRSWTGEGAAVTPGTPHYSEPFDMEGNTGLLVEVRLLKEPFHPLALASVHVQGTDDGKAERKNWVVEGKEIRLSPGTWERHTLREVRQQVRVVAAAYTPGEAGRIEIHLTRLP